MEHRAKRGCSREVRGFSCVVEALARHSADVAAGEGRTSSTFSPKPNRKGVMRGEASKFSAINFRRVNLNSGKTPLSTKIPREKNGEGLISLPRIEFFIAFL